MEDDDELQRIHDKYESGEMLTGELKKIAIEKIWAFVNKFQKRRSAITTEELAMFMDGSRPLRLGTRYNWTGAVISVHDGINEKKNFVPKESRYAQYPDELLSSIMAHVPLHQGQQLLYKNGEMDPALCSLEVELYQKNAQTPSFYIGFMESGTAKVESFSNTKEGESRVAELEKVKGDSGDQEYVVVNGLPSKS
jgi:hypothetical protein